MDGGQDWEVSDSPICPPQLLLEFPDFSALSVLAPLSSKHLSCLITNSNALALTRTAPLLPALRPRLTQVPVWLRSQRALGSQRKQSDSGRCTPISGRVHLHPCPWGRLYCSQNRIGFCCLGNLFLIQTGPSSHFICPRLLWTVPQPCLS